MAVTISKKETDEQVLRQWMFEWEVEFSADNDACQIDIGGADPHIGVIWQRSHTDVAVTFTIERETFDADPAVTTGWQAHPATGLMAWEQAPLVGLRFKRTGTNGTKVYIRTPTALPPVAVTGV